MGVVRGRTPKARSSERQTLDEPQTQYGTVTFVQPLRGGARRWGKDSFLPPNGAAPEPAPSTAHWRGKAPHLGT